MIGLKLKNARNASHLTQEEVAEKLQISRQTLSNWENGKTYPDINSILKLSDLYGISLDHLLKDDEKMLKHMEENMDTVKSNRAMILVWTLCPVIFIVYNLLTGGIVIRTNSFLLHGQVFAFSLLLVIAMSLISVAINVVALRARAKAAGNVSVREMMNKADVVRLVLPTVFGVLAFLTLCFFP